MPILEIMTPDGQVRPVSLTEPSYVLGRDAACDMAFPEDGGLSRQHFAVERQGLDWVILDRNSRNGTFVSGLRLQGPRKLQRGDIIKASRLLVKFTEPEHSSGVVFEKSSPEADPMRATVVVNLKDLLGGAGTRPGPAALGEKPKQWASPVQALLRAGRELVSGRPLPELFKVILDMAIEASGAQRGVLMTLEGEELVQQAGSDGEFRISSWVRDKVINNRESLLIQDALGDANLQQRASIILQEVHMLMAVPLQTEERVIGLIYVDSRSLLRPFTTDDLNLLTVMANVAAIRIDLQRLALVEKAEERHRMELEQAANIQKLSLPDKAPEVAGFAVDGRSVPCFAVGGDYYDYYPLADGRTMIVIGDVAGKGMPAALLVSSLQANASALALTASDLGKFVTQLNKVIRCPSDRFVTFFACIVDAEKEELIFCNAGHNPPLLLKTDGTTEQLPTAGLMLGVFPTVQYKAGVTHFDPGDQLFLYTDGITEAESPEHEEFDVENLEKVLRANAGLKPAELLDQILDRVEQWTNGAPASDDRTMVLVRRN